VDEMKEDEAIVKYWRFHAPYTARFDTLLDAFQFVNDQGNMGTISTESITYGDVVWEKPYTNSELRKMFPEVS
jgi:hypothetical protein